MRADDAARRYFAFTMAPGVPLAPVVSPEMRGQIGLGDKANPNNRPFEARQIIAFPHGFVWRLDAGAIGGSDGLLPTTSWTRFLLFGLVPGPHVRWKEAGPDIARAVVTYDELEQAVEIEVAGDRQPRSVVIQRWSSENSDRTYRLQPFGGYLSEYRDFGGYRLATRVEGSNHFGQDKFFQGGNH